MTIHITAIEIDSHMFDVEFDYTPGSPGFSGEGGWPPEFAQAELLSIKQRGASGNILYMLDRCAVQRIEDKLVMEYNDA